MAQQTYLLAPSLHFKPYTGPIALGSLIADPFRPHRVLTAINDDTLTKLYPPIETYSELERSITRQNGHDVTAKVWARFCHSIGLSLSEKQTGQKSSSFQIPSLVSKYFVDDPDQAQIKSRLEHPRVSGAMDSVLGAKRPVFMVSGIKIAQGLSATMESGKKKAAAVEASVQVPTPVCDVSAGTSVSGKIETTSKDSWKAGDDIVFAYQLLKIELKGWKKRVKVTEFRSKAAYLSMEDDEGGEDEDGDSNTEVVLSPATFEDMKDVGGHNCSPTVELDDGQVQVISFRSLD